MLKFIIPAAMAFMAFSKAKIPSTTNFSNTTSSQGDNSSAILRAAALKAKMQEAAAKAGKTSF